MVISFEATPVVLNTSCLPFTGISQSFNFLPLIFNVVTILSGTEMFLKSSWSFAYGAGATIPSVPISPAV